MTRSKRKDKDIYDGVDPYWKDPAGTAEYYRDALMHISIIGGIDYDGYDINKAESMRKLVDDLVNIANNALEGKPLYYQMKRNKDK